MNFIRGFSLTTGATGLVFVLGFVNQALLADHLGREAYGRLALWLNTVTIGSMVLGEWLARGSTYVVGTSKTRHAVLHNAILYSLLLGLALLPLVFIQPWLDRTAATMLVVLLAVTLLRKAAEAIAIGEDRLKLYSSIPLVFVATYLAGNSFVYLMGFDLREVLFAWFAASLIAALLGVIFLLPGSTCWNANTAIFRQTFVVGLRGATSVTLIFLMFRSDLYLVEYILGEGALGVYKVSTNFAEMMQRLPNVAGLVLLPKVIRGDEDNTRTTVQVARGIFIFSLLTGGILLFWGDLLLAHTFPKYGDAYLPLTWMLPGLLLAGFGSVLNTKLAGCGYPPVTIILPAIALLLNIVLNLMLIPKMGLIGAAISTSISYGFWALMVTLCFLRYSGLTPIEFLRPPATDGTINA